MNQIILATLPNDVAAMVIVNKTIVYTEDDDKGYHQYFTAKKVAEQLAKALNTTCQIIELTWKQLLEDEWTFDDVLEVVNSHN